MINPSLKSNPFDFGVNKKLRLLFQEYQKVISGEKLEFEEKIICIGEA